MNAESFFYSRSRATKLLWHLRAHPLRRQPHPFCQSRAGTSPRRGAQMHKAVPALALQSKALPAHHQLTMGEVCLVSGVDPALYRSQHAPPLLGTKGTHPRAGPSRPQPSRRQYFSMDNTLYCPVPYTYVVVRPDIQETVRNLDAHAQEASRTIRPGRCVL